MRKLLLLTMLMLVGLDATAQRPAIARDAALEKKVEKTDN